MGVFSGPLGEKFLLQSVGTLNAHAPICVNEEVSVAEVAGVLKQHRIGCVVVTARDGVLKGLLTERDIIVKVIGAFPDFTQCLVKEVMTHSPKTVLLETPIASALSLMSTGGFRHLPIVDSTLRPIGVISVKDVVDRIVALHEEALLELPTVV